MLFGDLRDVGPAPLANYTLQAIAPAPTGWRVVYWDGTRHVVEAVYMFGLATAPAAGNPPVFVSLAYAPQTGWMACELRPDFCGLLPPGQELGWYESQDPQGHVPTPAI